MMYRNRTVLIPKQADEKIVALYNEHRSNHFGSFKDQQDFIVYLLALGVVKAEADLRRSIAPSIVIPGQR